MKIAIIGSGISGLTVAHYLTNNNSDRAEQHQVTLFEANDYIGGHTDSHQVTVEGQPLQVDSGFIVFNEHNYPNFTALLRDLEVEWQHSDMSFSAVNEETGFYYGADGLGRLFSQKRNMVSPSFYRMLWDLVRFYKKAKQQLDNRDLSITLGDYLRKEGYSASFRDNHIIPMACALWSAPAASIEHFPLHYFLAFMHNHRMLQLSGRPQWKTVKGGSSQYVKKLLTQFKGNVRENTPVIRVRRNPEKAIVFSEPFGEEHFDVVVFACHSDQALRLLQDPSDAEKSILGAIHYQQNHVIVHTDRRFLPPKKSAWASWNARIPKSSQSSCSVSYWMNLLQNLPVETPVIVTLNPETTQVARIKESSILAQRNYSHPIYTKATVEAQQRKSEINGVNRTYYCGAYWGWGFHEDGVRSGLDVVNILERASC